jgi:hypothetical protein
MYSLFLIPITLWKLSGGSSEDGEVGSWAGGLQHWRRYGALLLYQGGVQRFLQVVKTWSTGKGSNGKAKQTSSMVAHLRTVFSNRMLVAWLAWGLVLWCVCRSWSTRLCYCLPSAWA